MSKVVNSIREAIIASGLKDGMTVSFHHHLRSGDYVLNLVMDEIAALGIKDLTINATSIHDGHTSLLKHIPSGVVTCIETPYIGPVVGKIISEGQMKKPAVFVTHGGRPSRIENGLAHIDVAFIGAPTSDTMGNCTGKVGKSACGSLGYSFVDAECADKVVVITDNLVPYPMKDYSIAEDHVDYVVAVDAIGNPAGIVSGTTKMPKDPIALKIAENAVKAIEASGMLKDGISFQTGAGGASLAVASFLRDRMRALNIRGSYALGGITGYIVDMLNEGLIEAIQDVQCFDLKAAKSIRTNPAHKEITVSHYASPTAKSSAADSLDVVALGATQIDLDFNVNVHTDSKGYIIGGSGGHTDVAECAKLTIIVAPLSRARMPIIVDKVLTISTPGSSVDLFVTQFGMAVNPARPELKEKLLKAKLPVVDITELKALADRMNGVPQKIAEKKDRVVGEVLNRDNSVLDYIYQV